MNNNSTDKQKFFSNTLNYSALNQKSSWHEFLISLKTYTSKQNNLIFNAIYIIISFIIIWLLFTNFNVVYLVVLFVFFIFVAVAPIVINSINDNTYYMKTKFCSDNNIVYATNINIKNIDHNGIIYNIGYGGVIEEMYKFTNNIELGNYIYKEFYGKEEKIYRYGYIAIKLDRMLPNLIIDSKSNNNFFSSLQTIFKSNQKLTLEGDFNKYFDVYAPQNYHQDALYVLTPDVMNTLVTNSPNLDIELVDDYLYIYSQPINLLNQTEITNNLNVAEILYSQIYKQTYKYNDDNIANKKTNIVATEGQKLQLSKLYFVKKYFIYILFAFILIAETIRNIIANFL